MEGVTMNARARSIASRLLGLLAVLSASWGPGVAEARITKMLITSVESPTFDGTSFGGVGQYEKLRGRAWGEVDPSDPRNAIITDIELAKNAAGKVEYSMDVLIIKPIDSARGNGQLLYHMNNRGNIGFLGSLNDGGGGNDPTTAAHAGNGFLMRRGYTIVSSGWDGGVTPGGNRLTISVPVARNADSSPIVGPSLDEFVVDSATMMTGVLTYPAATTDKSQASLTVRTHYTDPPVSIPDTGWDYTSAAGTAIRLLPAGTLFQQGRLYEFTYPAKDPIVAGLGLAATRDLGAFLRQAVADDDDNPNPLAGSVHAIYTHCISQPCRTMRDFVHLGFNESEDGDRVIDGVLNWIGGASGIFLNFRFAQPGRTQRQHIGRWYPERQFPFAHQTLTDAVTGKTAGRLERCTASGTCPRFFEINSANEYWVKVGSALHTDTLGSDLPDAPGVRSYLMSSLPHGAGSGLGNCAYPRNPLGPGPVLRALLVALDEWAIAGTEPPASRVPQRSDGTAVTSLPQAQQGFPDIPGILYDGLMSTGDLFDFGPTFDDGIVTLWGPPVSSPYPAFVPKTDVDGNDIAGIRLPEVAVPVATYAGWNRRAANLAFPDLCDASGLKIDFAQTKAERLAAGDPRLSIEERYPSHGTYVSAIAEAVNSLHADRLLLPEDVQRYMGAAVHGSIGKPASAASSEE
jgi:hypothetical protein